MLNPAVHFKSIVDEARSVILCGGTMSPTAFVQQQLFSTLPPSKIDVFSCGHIVAPERILGVCIDQGPSGVPFDFTHRSRALPRQMDELGRLLYNLSRIVPDGIVCFVPSFAYLGQLLRRWGATGDLQRISQRKRGGVMVEPRRAEDVAEMLERYTRSIRVQEEDAEGERSAGSNSGPSKSGAVLMSVVGGKMSEGINFSDELARCVVMVGLPYPNPTDVELRAKMEYLDNKQREQRQEREQQEQRVAAGVGEAGAGGAIVPALSGGSGREFYESLCMKAVNQSIGRAIRHQGDYASILLVDQRYSTNSRVRDRLPGWIRERVIAPPNFGQSFASVARFFKGRAAAAAAGT
jgi:chromosome transmission fidelity protein 1